MAFFQDPQTLPCRDDYERQNRVSSLAHTLACLPLYVPMRQVLKMVPLNYHTAYTFELVKVHWAERAAGNEGIFTPSGDAVAEARAHA